LEQRGARPLQKARVAEIIDVFGGAAEVHQLECGLTGAGQRELLANVIFDCFDVVIDARLDRFHRPRAILIGLMRKAFRPRSGARRQGGSGKLRHGLREVQQPARLDADALPDEAGLGEQLAHRSGGCAIAAVNRRERIARPQDVAACIRHALPDASKCYDLHDNAARSPAPPAAMAAADPGGPRERGTGEPCMTNSFRIERDSMGELQVPADALWGAQTQRAVQNFPISGLTMPRAFIAALGLLKQAAARANTRLELLDPAVSRAIDAAAAEVAAGQHDAQFPID